MATTVSSKKRIRQNKKRNLQNKARKSAARTQVKKVLAAVSEGNAAIAETELKVAHKLIDKCGRHNAFHPNKTAHMKASLTKKVKSIKSS